MGCNRQCRSVNALPGHSSLRARESSPSQRACEINLPTQILSDWRERIQQTWKKNREKFSFSQIMSLSNVQGISSYVATSSQFQCFYSELLACFPIYQTYTWKACYSTSSFIYGRFTHIWNQTEAFLCWELKKQSTNRIRPLQYPLQYKVWYDTEIT